MWQSQCKWTLRTLITSALYSDHISFVSLVLWSRQLRITHTLITSASYSDHVSFVSLTLWLHQLRTLITSASYHSHSDHISFVSLVLWSRQLCITLRLAASWIPRDEDDGFDQLWSQKFMKPWPPTWNLGSITLSWLWCLDYKFSCQSATLLLWYNHLVAMVLKSNRASTSVTNYPCSALASGHRQLSGCLQ